MRKLLILALMLTVSTATMTAQTAKEIAKKPRLSPKPFYVTHDPIISMRKKIKIRKIVDALTPIFSCGGFI